MDPKAETRDASCSLKEDVVQMLTELNEMASRDDR